MMAKHSGEDPTSIGNILLKLGAITKKQLKHALQQQEELKGDDLLGRLLVASGSCTESELSMAMAAQASMRNVDKKHSAMAVADLALKRHRRGSIVTRRDNIIAQAEKVQKKITGDEHPVVRPGMLAKPENS